MGMSKTTESRSDSDAQLVTFTGTPGGGAVKVDLHIVPTVIPTLTVAPDPEPESPTPIVCPSVKQLALEIEQKYNTADPATRPKSLRAALQAATHFYVDAKGHPVKLRSLESSLYRYHHGS